MPCKRQEMTTFALEYVCLRIEKSRSLTSEAETTSIDSTTFALKKYRSGIRTWPFDFARNRSGQWREMNRMMAGSAPADTLGSRYIHHVGFGAHATRISLPLSFYLSLSLIFSFSLAFSLSLSLSLSLSSSLSFNLFISRSRSFSLSLHQSLSRTHTVSLSPFLSFISLSLSHFLSIYLSICLSVSLSH